MGENRTVFITKLNKYIKKFNTWRCSKKLCKLAEKILEY